MIRFNQDIYPDELAKGIAVEMEHTDDVGEAMKIALDHLYEDSFYYKKLAKCFPHEHKTNPDLEDHYRLFHGIDPDAVIDGRVWVPGPVIFMGYGVNVEYGIEEDRSSKDGRYVHDFGEGVKVYRRAEKNEHPDKVYQRFPKNLMILGCALGFTYTDGDEEFEVRGNKRKKLAVTPNRKTLVIVGPSGVEFLMSGGNMKVTDWIHG